ncbi:MAG: hypothetical protein OEZ08_16995 [Betaproteobacteria bacterium]|nr:hypothetical protein [Betaproteobacteria bacterium]
MKRAKKAAVALAVGTAMCAVLGTAQAQVYVDTCRNLGGFNSGTPGMGAWATVQANSTAFLSRRMVQSCEILYPESSGKGKPSKNLVILEQQMRQDECSMYRYLGSIDSKLAMAKVGDAYVVSGEMISKISSLYTTGQLGPDGYDPIFKAATAVQTCIYDLMSQ